MTQYHRSQSSTVNSTLWIAIGAAAGLAAGVLLADKLRGRRRIVRRLHAVLRALQDWSESDDADELDEDAGPEEHDTDDAPRIDERVLAAFEQDPVLAERSIEIDEPEPGTIVLAGRVPYADDVAHAVTIARGVPGVVHVEQHLRVRTRARPARETRSGA